MGCHSLLQRIFPTQGSNPGLQHCSQILYHLSHQGSPQLTWFCPQKLAKTVTLVVSPIAPGSETSLDISSSNLCSQILQEQQLRMAKAILRNENYILSAPQLIINIHKTQVARYFKPLNYLSLGETWSQMRLNPPSIFLASCGDSISHALIWGSQGFVLWDITQMAKFLGTATIQTSYFE